MTKYLVYLVTCVAACAIGYIGRIFVERRQRLHRERVLRVLGGKIPDWQADARRLEDRATACLAEMTKLDNARGCARILQAEADTIRRRGRRRDREWT